MISFKIDHSAPLRILCLGAHCDDIEMGAGGTLLKIFEEYQVASVMWVVFASNEIRKKEAKASARQFLQGIQEVDVRVCSYQDGFLPCRVADLKGLFEDIKAVFHPDLIFTHYRDDRHQDHRLISDLTWNTWRNHQILEYEILKYDGDLGNPNFFVPLKEEYLTKRNQIIAESFVSQKEKHWFGDAAFEALPRLRGVETVAKYAEAFYTRKLSI